MNPSTGLHAFSLVMGDDTISREKTKQNIIDAVRRDFPEALVERFDAENQSFTAFAERIITPSMFQAVRIFMVRDAHTFKKNDLEALQSLFAYDIPDVYVVIESSACHAKKSKLRWASKEFDQWFQAYSEKTAGNADKFGFFEYPQPAEYKMAQWVEAQTPLLLARSISRRDAEYLVDLVGSEGATLYSELQKIDVFLAPKKPIDRQAIETVCGATRLMSQFELAQAMGKKDFVKVLEIIDSLYAGSVYLPLYLSAIFKHFWSLFRIRLFAKSDPDTIRKFEASMKRFDKQTQEDAGLAIGMAAGLLTDKQRTSVYPVMVKPGIVAQAMSFTEAHYKKIFTLLKNQDIGIKTGRIDDSKIGFQLLCYTIVKIADLGN